GCVGRTSAGSAAYGNRYGRPVPLRVVAIVAAVTVPHPPKRANTLSERSVRTLAAARGAWYPSSRTVFAILRPCTPPDALTCANHASAPAEVGRQTDETGPVSALEVPMRISVLVMPAESLAPPPPFEASTPHPAAASAAADSA